MPPYRFHAELRHRLNVIIFGTDTPAGKRFDLFLIYAIFASVVLVMLDSVQHMHDNYAKLLIQAEWAFTIAFTIEYLTRIYCTVNKRRYLLSFYGLVDLLSIIPTYLTLLFTGANVLVVVRLLRVLRIFRILKLIRYLNEANVLLRALRMSRRKIFVFFCAILVLTSIYGSLMYAVEGPNNGFSSIPKSIYWAIVTMTTVGYGDITPHTVLGQLIASVTMLTGYAIIAVPTGIITAEIASEMRRERLELLCGRCTRAGHETDAEYCKFCGTRLNAPVQLAQQ
jgi:voltage-gated potassium channel